MIFEKLKVVKCDDQYMWLEVNPKTACGSCHHNGQCGVSSLAKVFKFNKDNNLKLKKTINVEKNDWVEISIPDQVLLKSSFLVYFVPVISMIIFSIVFKLIYNTEFSSISGAVLGLIVSTLIIRKRSLNITLQGLVKPEIVKLIQ